MAVVGSGIRNPIVCEKDIKRRAESGGGEHAVGETVRGERE
jgi:hypothetical protein